MFSSRNLDVFLVTVSLVLVSRLVFLSEAREIRPSDHGLPRQTPGAVSPATESFFGNSNSSSGMELPEAKNSSDPIWGFFDSSPPVKFRRREVKSANPTTEILLLASFICGGVGIVFLVAALYVYFVQKST